MNKELVGEVIIAENGALKTFASYYKGHLNLNNFNNMGGQHVWGFTGAETRILSKRLLASRTFEVFEPNETMPIPTNINTENGFVLKANDAFILQPQ